MLPTRAEYERFIYTLVDTYPAVENSTLRDELILKKTRVVRPLDELVKREVEPISSENLNALIHEARE